MMTGTQRRGSEPWSPFTASHKDLPEAVEEHDPLQCPKPRRGDRLCERVFEELFKRGRGARVEDIEN